jgi:hypothetical protein
MHRPSLLTWRHLRDPTNGEFRDTLFANLNMAANMNSLSIMNVASALRHFGSSS